ncbi:MAG: bifunctional precorrin-2 dehydrogenase/sirohydrochlorin ferrochelatase [Actinomycetes bacterium]
MTLVLAWDLTGRRCVVVGGGTVGTRRSSDLLRAGAKVTVVSPAVTDELTRLAAEGEVSLEQVPASAAVLDRVLEGAALVVAAADRPEVNELVAERARRRGVLVNRADDAPAGDVTWTTSVRRGPVGLAVTTGGQAPAVARFVAQQLDEHLDGVLGLDSEQLAALVMVVAEVRRSLRSDGRRPAPVDWRSEQATTILEAVRSGRTAEAKERLQAWQSS